MIRNKPIAWDTKDESKEKLNDYFSRQKAFSGRIAHRKRITKQKMLEAKKEKERFQAEMDAYEARMKGEE